MIKFSIVLIFFRYSRLKFVEEETFFAKDKTEAKNIAKNFINSTKWVMDLMPVPDLRT